MANEDDIRQRVIIEGAQGALSELQKLGNEGAAAIDKIKDAGGGDFVKGFRNISPELNKMVDGLADAAVASTKLQKSTRATRTELTALAGLKRGPEDLKQGFDEAGESVKGLDFNTRTLARTMRGLARVTNIPGLAFLARDARALSANLALLIGPAIIGGLGLLADNAAKATQPFQELAFAAGQLPQALQTASGAAVAFGGDVTKLGTALSKLPGLAKETAQQEKAMADASANVRTVIDQGNTTLAKHAQQVKNAALSYEDFRLQIALGLDPVSGLREQISELSKSYADGKVSVDQYNKQSAKLNNQLLFAQRQQRQEQARLQQAVQDANLALADQEEAQLKAERAAIASRKSAEEGANAFVKLGVSAAQLKALKPQEAFELIAQKLEPMEKGFKRNQLAIEIFGDQARLLVNELDKGTGSVAKFVKEGQRIAPAFTTAQNEIGDKFLTSIGKLTAAAGSLKDAFGLAIAPAFTTFFNGLVELFVQARPAVEDFGKAIGPGLQVFLQGLIEVLKGIGVAIGLVTSAFQFAASLLNGLFGTNAFTGGRLFIGLLVAIAAAFLPITTAIVLFLLALGTIAEKIKGIDFNKLATQAVDVFNKVKATIVQFIADFFTAVGNLVTGAVQPIVDFFVRMWEGIKTLFNDGAIFISNAFDTAVGFVTGLWESFKGYLRSWVSSVISFFQPLIDMIKKIGAFFASDAGSGNGSATAGAFAGGGSVSGPGSATSDSILAWLSDGEFVMRARAVAKYGLGFMRAINSGRLNLEALAGFSLGGLVDSLSPNFGPMHLPAYASGGAVDIPGQGLKPVSISFEGTQFAAFMTDTAINQLSKKSIRDRAKRAGRSPSWVGG
jgi:hypothetical protein